MKRFSWCAYEELDEGVGTTVFDADIPLQVEDARALLKRIGDDYERAGWDVIGEGDYVPSSAALDNRSLLPTDTEGHPENELSFEPSRSLLSLRVTSACYRSLEGEGLRTRCSPKRATRRSLSPADSAIPIEDRSTDD
jgi:hypothetical protein